MFDCNLIDLINKKKQQLLKELNTDNEKAEFLKNFIATNNFYGLDNIEKVDLIDLFITTFLTHCNNFPFSKIKEITYENKKYFENLPSEYFNTLFGYIYEIGQLDDFEEQIKIYHQKNKLKISVNNLFSSTSTISKLIMLIKYDKANETNSLSLIELSNKHPDEFFHTLSLIYSIIAFREEISNYKEDFEELKALIPKRISQKTSKKIIYDEILSEYNMEPYKKHINEVISYCQKIVSEEKNKQKELHKELKNILILEEWIEEKNETNSHLNICPSLTKIKDEKIKLSTLKAIYKHNYNLCIETEKKHDNLLKNTRNHYKKVLKKYNINIPDNEINFKMSVDELKDFLEQAKKLNLIDNIDIIKALKTTTKDICDTLISYINKGYINAEFIKNNQEIFESSEENDLYRNLENNINYLNSQKISSSIIMKMKDNLLEKNELIINGVKTLKNYQLFQSLKKASSYQFIKDNELDEKIDFLIELGYETNLQENLDLLNYTIEDYKRLVILNRLNIPVETTNELENILGNKNFVINNDKMNDYLFDKKQYVYLENTNSISKKEFQELLEEQNEAPNSVNSYIFNNVIISKNKLKRELEAIPKEKMNMNDQFKCLTKNKILSDEDCTTIINILNSGKIKQERKNLDKIYEKTIKN